MLLLSPVALERYREVSLLPTSLIDAEQLLASGLRGLAFDERIDQLVSEEMARSALLLPLGQSLDAFHQLLNTIEHKSMR